MTPEEFAAIEARANAASAGPWESDGDYNRAEISQAAGGWATIVGTEEVGSGHLRENVLILSAADSQFIAHARKDIPRLLDAVRERDNIIARIRDIVESVHLSDDLDPDGYQVAGLIRAALDPQETQ